MAGTSGTEASDETGEVFDRDLIGRILGVLSEEEREAIALRFGADLQVPPRSQSSPVSDSPPWRVAFTEPCASCARRSVEGSGWQ